LTFAELVLAELDCLFILPNRSQSVVVNALPSDSVTLTSGVPQGSVLGPLLYLAYANPLSSVLEGTNLNNGGLDVLKMGQFSDDTQLRIGFRLRPTPYRQLSALSMIPVVQRTRKLGLLQIG
jgi:hypothetical protein